MKLDFTTVSISRYNFHTQSNGKIEFNMFYQDQWSKWPTQAKNTYCEYLDDCATAKR